MIKKYKWKLLAASIVTLLSGLLGIFAPAERLGAEGFRWAIIGLPVLLLALLWLGMWITSKDPKGNEQNSKVLNIVIWIIPALSLLVSGMLDFSPENRPDYEETAAILNAVIAQSPLPSADQ